MVDERDRCGNVRARALRSDLRASRSNSDEQREWHRQHHDEIFRPQRHADRQAEQKPMPEPAAAQRAVEGKAGQCPERQLDDVVIELGGRVVEVVQAVDDEHGDQRADGAGERPRGQEDQPQRRHHGGLRQQVVSEVVADEPVHDLDQPPGQRRQLVVTELPFAAVGQRLDQIERQIGVKQGRKGRPDRRRGGPEWRPRPARAPRRSDLERQHCRAPASAERSTWAISSWAISSCE